MSSPGGRPADVPARQTRPYSDVVKILLGCTLGVFWWWIQTQLYFSVLKSSFHSFSIFFFFYLCFPFFSSFHFVFLGCFVLFFLVSVKTPAKSVWWAVWLGAWRGPWRRLIWGLRCRRHRVQTNSHGNPGCGTLFSVSPRGPSLPPGSPPAPSWHRSGSYPSNWQEKTQQALNTTSLWLQWEADLKLNASSTQEAKPRVEVVPESGTTENTTRKKLMKTQPVKFMLD